jgi:hypothetical protein
LELHVLLKVLWRITIKLTGPRTPRPRTRAPPLGAGPVQRLVRPDGAEAARSHANRRTAVAANRTARRYRRPPRAGHGRDADAGMTGACRKRISLRPGIAFPARAILHSRPAGVPVSCYCLRADSGITGACRKPISLRPGIAFPARAILYSRPAGVPVSCYCLRADSGITGACRKPISLRPGIAFPMRAILHASQTVSGVRPWGLTTKISGPARHRAAD